LIKASVIFSKRNQKFIYFKGGWMSIMNSEHSILDEIIKNVDKSGSYEISLKVLEENVFNHGHKPRRPVREHILIWAVGCGINYEYKNNGNDEIVRFYRKIK
jgi:hypothetical protein